MSYIAVEKMLSFLVEGQEQFCRWVSEQRSQATGIQASAMLDKLQKNADIRLKSFQQAMTDSDEKELQTQLQYDGSDDIRQALEELPTAAIGEVQDIEAAASNYYRAVQSTLRESEQVSEAAPSRLLFQRLAQETEAVAENDAWASRGLP